MTTLLAFAIWGFSTSHNDSSSVELSPKITLPAREIRLEELKAIKILLLVLDSLKLGKVFTDLITDAKFPFRSDDLIVLLVFKLLLA